MWRLRSRQSSLDVNSFNSLNSEHITMTPALPPNPHTFWQWFPTAAILLVMVVIPIFMIVHAVRKIQKRRTEGSEQSLWACINEVGGYLLAGAALLAITVIVAIANLVESGG